MNAATQRRLIRDALADRPVQPVSELLARGATRSGIAAAAEAGELRRVWRGIVASPGAEGHERIDQVAATLQTGGILARRTAAAIHGLTDDVPDEIEVLVPSDQTRAPSTQPVRLIRSRMPESFSLGVVTERVLGVDVRVTDPARTVVDHYRERGRHIRQHALQALASYLQANDPGDLFTLAVAFDRDGRLTEALVADVEAMRLTQDSGMQARAGR